MNNTEVKKILVEREESTAHLPSADFTKKDTAAVKGIAVCLLLVHHLYMGVLAAPMSIFGNEPLTVFATLSKVCVALFTFLSGYGLSISYKRRKQSEVQFQGKHIMSLMMPYWLVFASFAILAVFFAREQFTPWAVYGEGIKGIGQALAELFALRPILGTATLNQTWWYMEAALVLYLLFPLLYRITERVPYIALPLAAFPLFAYYLLGNNEWDTCREIFWLLPFCAGIFASQRDLLAKYSSFAEKKTALTCSLSAVLLIIFAVIRAKVGLAFDTFFAISIILFLRATLCRIPYIYGLFAYLGKYSAYIFLTHSFFYCYFISQTRFATWFLLKDSVMLQLLALPILLALSLGVSIALDAVMTQIRLAIEKLRK